MKIEYPYLPEGRMIKYVPGDNPFMKEAKDVCRKLSTDRQFPTGAVLVQNGKSVLAEANQSAIKNPTLLKWHQKGLCVRKFLNIPTGKQYWLCPGCASSRNHAERGLIRKAGRLGVETNNAELYLWGHWWCCEPCWTAMIKAGIKDVYLLEGSERLFNKSHPDNIIGRQFQD